MYYTDKSVTAEIQRITGQTDYVPTDPQKLANHIFMTCYMGSENSSSETQSYAVELAGQIGR